MSEIHFKNFQISKKEITLDYIEDTGSQGNLYFKLTPPIKIRSDLIALALSTLCGQAYKKINFDLNLTVNTIQAIESFSKAEVRTTAINTKDNSNFKKHKNKNIILNFSGGFDSLASKCLMPQNTKLVSMDFGGKFSRERPFFEKFNPCIVETNIVETNFRKNSWSFMGIGAILYSDYLKANYQSFGSILEVSPRSFREDYSLIENKNPDNFKAAGMDLVYYVLGLSEVGTLKVLSYYKPELIKESLKSLANIGEEKRCRKEVLARIASDRFGTKFDFEMSPPPPKQHFKFGDSFAPDFLSLYIIKYLGVETASFTISDIPKEAIKIANSLSLDFYEHYNTNFLKEFPKDLLSGLLEKLGECGVIPYTEKDWKEFHEVRSFLSKYHEL